MDANLMRYVRICRKAWWLLLGVLPAIAAAQTLVDPTKPPDWASTRPEGNALQSIIISPTRRAAIIRGQTVELGEKVGDVRLIEVNESGVVLQGEKGLEVLTLFPNVKMNKRSIVPPAAADAKHPARKSDLVQEPVSGTGKREGK